MTDIVVLADGYSRLSNNKMIADATCTLVKTSDELILVDTLGPWNANKLIDLINKQGFHIEDITYVVCTHGHSDHLGNLNLFTNNTQSMAIAIQNQLNSTSSINDNLSTQKRSKIKKHFVGNTIYYDDEYDWSDNVFKDKLFKINDNIAIRQTPGHTLSCISLLIENCVNKGRVAISGDLFENKSDLDDDSIWLDAGSESEELQRLNRKFILDNYDYIVPGHGEIFKIKK